MDLYEAMQVLGIKDIHITADEAKKQYRSVMKKYHPDNHPEKRLECEAMTKRINEAYGVIENALKNGELGPNAESKRANSSSSTNNTNQSDSEREAYWRKRAQEEAYYRKQAEENARREEERLRREAEAERRRDHSKDKFTAAAAFEKIKGTGLFGSSVLFGLLSLAIIFDLSQISSTGNALENEASTICAYMLLVIIFKLVYRFGKTIWEYTYSVLVTIIVTTIALSAFGGIVSAVESLFRFIPNVVQILIVLTALATYEYRRNARKILFYRHDNPYPPEQWVSTLLVYEYIFVFVSAIVLAVLSVFMV